MKRMERMRREGVRRSIRMNCKFYIVEYVYQASRKFNIAVTVVVAVENSRILYKCVLF